MRTRFASWWPNRNPAVRKEAIFWLGQSNDPRALDYLEEILTK